MATHICRLWNQLILSRRRLRTNAFLPSTYQPNVLVSDIELHPVLSTLHFDGELDPTEAEYGCHHASRKIASAPVAEQMATSPPVPQMHLAVMSFQPHLVVSNPEGVKVMDVVRELAK